MELIDGNGRAIEKIRCGVFVVGVVERNGDGSQLQGQFGQAIQIDTGKIDVEAVPEACPLAVELASRELGHFSVCQTCPHAKIET